MIGIYIFTSIMMISLTVRIAVHKDMPKLVKGLFILLCVSFLIVSTGLTVEYYCRGYPIDYINESNNRSIVPNEIYRLLPVVNTDNEKLIVLQNCEGNYRLFLINPEISLPASDYVKIQRVDNSAITMVPVAVPE